MPVTNEQLSSMVEEYCSHRPDWERQIAFYTNIEDFAELLDKAGRAVEENERKCKHQRRQQRDDLLACSERLLARQSEFEQAENFEQIHQLVIACTRDIFKAAWLYWYDTALRISVNRKIYPEKVYLQAGAKKGGLALLGRDAVAQYRCRNTGIIALPKKCFPEPLQCLEPYQIEDFLCGYAEDLVRWSQESSATLC